MNKKLAYDYILRRMYSSTLKFLMPLDLRETYKRIVDEAIKLVGADSGAIHLLEDGEFRVAYASNPLFYDIKPRKRANVYRAFKTQRAFASDMSNIKKAHPQVRHMGLKAAIFIPLSYQKKPLGVLAVNTKKVAYFDQETLKILILFGSLASITIRKAQLNNELSQALETRDIFISMAAHEFRTPITSISGYTQLIQSRVPPNDGTISRWVEGLASETYRLTLLLRELLTIEHIKFGEIVYNWRLVSLSKVINRAISNFHFTSPEREIIFEDHLGEKSDKAIGDFDKLLQVLNNLLENAAKFSKSTTPIRIDLDSNRLYLTIRIQDYGIGISKEDSKKIFARFYRGRTDREGIGIGLYLVKDIIDHHRGQIKIHSKQNVGTEVKIKLPKVKE